MDVSIIIPCYNNAPYLKKCIDSVLSQTYKSIEIIVVDDGSDDNTSSVVEEYIASDAIKYFQIKHSGVSTARNKGIDEAEGDYIAFIDSDDYVANDFVERLVFSARTSDADIVWSQYSEVINNETFAKDNGLSRETVYTRKEALKFFYGHTIGLGSLCNKLYKRSFITSNNLKINESRTRAEDWEFNLHAFSCLGSLMIIKDHLYYYVRQNSSSIMASFREKDFEFMCFSSQLLSEFNDKYQLGMNPRTGYNSNAYFFLEYIIKASFQSNEVSIKAIKNVLHSTIYFKAISNCDASTLPIFFRLIRIITFTKNAWLVKKICRLVYGTKHI